LYWKKHAEFSVPINTSLMILRSSIYSWLYLSGSSSLLFINIFKAKTKI